MGVKPRVLVVDDAPMNLRLLSEILRRDCRVVVATGGREALDIARAQLPELILLDVMMPEMDGFEVCRRLKADPTTTGVPVIFITAVTQPEELEKGLALGAVGFIAKPINPAEVQARVWSQLGRPGEK
jgi:CheY-like chemotaxis protein